MEAHLAAIFERATRRPPVPALAQRMDYSDATYREKRTLLIILLVEGAARPRVARMVEWTIFVMRQGVPGRWGRAGALRMTLGPFQLRGSPFRQKNALAAALAFLRACPGEYTDFDALARFWNGEMADSAGAVPYRAALELAAPHVDKMLNEARLF